ncbi:zinc finger CCCH domain-containing protein [Plasmodium brasilianum]|uniref:Zinc finger protein, putative n=2 Tax=Plasmodium (Plasmodium) TaxID=418103 RepID=A0A1A8W630_PLAMA|nr:zinc finger protein, putative [Plasmodium malariae]KAI4836649.1 zinc finger CCCH domain-containing protein [Plasmodium brasilianum]SBS88431.1 zinc finger protein, putative [Plasmodium malariae]SCO93930.1 zinc finger protein, putative [Plasmodium malariae]
MEKINDQEVLKRITNITGNLTKASSCIKRKGKKKKKRKYKKIVEGKWKNVEPKKKQTKKIVDLFEDFKIQKKKETCKFFFKKGKCIHNENCTYSHDVTPIYKISKLCKFLIKGKCDKENCIFSHDYQLFFCRNNVIYNSCHNPMCKFKHIKIDNTINNADQYNLEVDNVLSKDDKIRFLYNNKNYLMELLIHKYHQFDNYDELNIDELIKKETYPWFINGIIDLIKVDFKYSKAHVFFKLVTNYKKKTYSSNLNIPDHNANFLENRNRSINEESTGNSYSKVQDNYSEQQSNQQKDITNKINNNKSASANKYSNDNDNEKEHEHNNDSNKNGEESFNDCKFYSSEEEEDYEKYLNKHFEIDS